MAVALPRCGWIAKCFLIGSAAFLYTLGFKLLGLARERTTNTATSCWKHLEAEQTTAGMVLHVGTWSVMGATLGWCGGGLQGGRLARQRGVVHARCTMVFLRHPYAGAKYTISDNRGRSYWIPGSYAPTLSTNRHSFLTLLKNKGSKEESMTKVGLLRHRQLHVPGIQQEPDPFLQQEEA
jgi:hypothetical protein